MVRCRGPRDSIAVLVNFRLEVFSGTRALQAGSAPTVLLFCRDLRTANRVTRSPEKLLPLQGYFIFGCRVSRAKVHVQPRTT